MKGKWYAFGCLTSLVLVIVVLVLIFTSINSYMTSHRTEKKKIQSGTWLVLNLENQINEFTEFSDDIWGRKQNSAHSYIQKIKKATEDDMIKGLIIHPKMFSCGYSTLNSMMEAIEEFQQKGKPVYAYLNSAANRGYYLASASDKIFLNPSASAGIILTGIGGHILYYEELLDKLGIEMQVVHAGKYKAAGEQFNRKEMSPEFRENLTALYRDIYDEMITTIANNRKLDKKAVRSLYEERSDIWINGEFALKSGLIDGLVTYKEFLSSLEHGSSISEEKLVSIIDYNKTELPSSLNKVAVIYAQGSITTQTEASFNVITAAKMQKIIDAVKKDAKIKAVVLRVNSPGGSALESEIILNSIKELQREKPVVVSMGDVAASGGYYISCSADQIFADPMTITGSIGVVAMFPNLTEMSDKIGINSSTVSYGRYTDILNPFTPPDPDEMAAVKSSIMQVYDEFKGRVATGRDLTLNQVEDIAQGRVWSSQQALKHGLIDQIGDTDSAIEKAAEIAGITNYRVTYLPEQKTLMDYFLKEYFDIEMAVSVFTHGTKSLDVLNELKRLESIENDPNQAYCPVDIR